MTHTSLRDDVILVATAQLGRPAEDVAALLEYEWQNAGLALADRGLSEYLGKVRDEIVRRAVKEKHTVAAITGFITDDTLHWAASQGLALDKYAFILGLLVAWATHSALKAAEVNSETEPGEKP